MCSGLTGYAAYLKVHGLEPGAAILLVGLGGVGLSGLAAAKAVFDWHDRVDVPERMARAGGALLALVQSALADAPWVQVRADGPPMMWQLTAEVPEALDALVASAAHAGVLLKRGAYQFGAVAHDQRAIDSVAAVLPGIMHDLQPGPRR